MTHQGGAPPVGTQNGGTQNAGSQLAGLQVGSLHIGSATRPMPGEVENGDGVFTKRVGAATWFGVIDALGHGPFAALTTSLALSHLGRADLAAVTGVDGAIQGLHLALRGTRGAAALLCRLEGDTLSCCGVGNVDMRRFGVKIAAHVSPGVLGGVLARRPVAATGTMPSGTRLALFSDGVSAKFGADDVAGGDLEQAAAALLARFARNNDDATVLIAEVRS